MKTTMNAECLAILVKNAVMKMHYGLPMNPAPEGVDSNEWASLVRNEIAQQGGLRVCAAR
jgi:hypothetical protein